MEVNYLSKHFGLIINISKKKNLVNILVLYMTLKEDEIYKNLWDKNCLIMTTQI